MKRRAVRDLVVLLMVPIVCGATLGRCDLPERNFEKISLNGFDPEDNAKNLNDYPWSMAYFVPDGGEGFVYVGTGNGVFQLAMDMMGMLDPGDSPYRPAQIRRYRPDLGATEWEKVFDFRDIESGPIFSSTGFRNMMVYRAKSDGVNYLYASTYGNVPAIWRSANGEPGSWQQVWTSSSDGSIRWMTPHRDLLYFGLANEFAAIPTPGEVWATDGDSVWPVMQGGFGNPNNVAIDSLTSYNDWLYACTANVIDGFEVWKLEGPGPEGSTPIKVVGAGGPDARNQSASTPCVFQGKLYIGSVILAGIKFKGCDLIRIDELDHWETIVGPDGLSGYGSGFNNLANGYLWWMTEYEGWLYAGTWDMSSVLQYVVDDFPGILYALPHIIDSVSTLEDLGVLKRTPTALTESLHGGGDLYKSQDGVHWERVFDDGLGNPYNYGVRTMVSTGGYLYLGMANPFEGLEIWRSLEPIGNVQGQTAK